MALPRGQWDVTYLASKYPWLRVDQQTLEDFRSPFNWVADALPVSPACSSDDGKVQVQKRNRKHRVRFKGEEPQPRRNGRHKGKKKKVKRSEIQRNHEKLFSSAEIQTMNNVPSIEELTAPSICTQDTTTMMPLLSIPTVTPSKDRLENSDLMLELLQRDHNTLLHIRRHKKTRRKPIDVLALKFPIITTKSLSSVSKLEAFKLRKSPTSRSLLNSYAKQIQNLTEEEHRLEESVMARIAEEKSRLPLTFLFERNLMHRSDAQVDGLRVVTAIFAKLQHRILFNSFTRWKEFLEAARHEDRRIEALLQAQKRAIKLLERVSSDAYVGTLAQGFQFWRTVTQQVIEQERNRAASVIQKALRARRSMLHLETLRQAAQAADYRRHQAIQALLRFERYGTMMKWGTLRIGFDFAKQNRAARNLQLFLRRVAVRRRVGHRVRCKEGAIRIQAQWRAHLARQEVAIRREERVRRIIFETKAAIQMERIVRGFLGRNQVFRRKQWLIKANLAAFRLQRWLRHRLFIAVLHSKFRERKRLIEYARARASAEELARLPVQCVFRGLLARRIYERKLRAHRKEHAAIYLQRFWRRRRGLYALGLRFAERKERLIQCRLQGAIVIQSSFRCYRARCKRSLLAAEKEERRQASIVIQRHVRGWIARNRYRRARQAAVIIQSSIRCALARRSRTRRYQAVLKLQQWARGVYACRAARKVLNRLRAEARRREASVLLIQKLVRQREAEQTARLFREALNIVKTEQRRYFGSESDDVRGGVGWSTHQASSELLTYVTQRFLEDDSCFTTKELRWLRAQVQAGHERLIREDRAAVFLQRRYRGYATRMGYWVHRLQMEELRRLKEKKAIVIQSGARRWLATRHVRRVREQRRLAELKEAYIRERKRKEEERVWKERYDREQMELCVQRAQEAANQLREARREADLARVKAEAAEYRAKELAAERKIESLLKTPVKQNTEEDDDKQEEVEDEKDPWIQLQDDYGNVYYYNESSGESSWDPPPKRPKTSPEEEEPKGVETELPETSEEAKVEEIDPLEEILREGKCIKCQQLQAAKRCLDCDDTKRAFYCTLCFKQHTTNPNEENLPIARKTRHDFEVVPEAAAIPARCQSEVECTVDDDTNNQETREKDLAAYYCYGCSTPNHTSTTVAHDTEPSGLFYCESCFARDHDTAQKLRHVEKALRFRRGALLCCDCGHALAVRQCESCGGDKFCENCFTSSHTGSKTRTLQHTWTALDVLRDVLEKETDRYCVECDVRASSRLCNLCGDGFCDGCFNKTHAKGAKRRHTWLPWSVAAQHGDWIEIKDKRATIYFNVETKESTNEKPPVLLSGEERHRLELAEREQLQRSRQIELESEVVKLKEQLRELQQQERPGSRDRAPVKDIDNCQSKPPPRPPKRGVLSKLFGRTPPPQAPTVEERQQIAEDPAIRARAEKQPVSSPVFQQAMSTWLNASASFVDTRILATDNAKMTPEEPVPQRGSPLLDDGENDKPQDLVLVQQTCEETSVEVNVPLDTESYHLWSMDDIDGAVTELLGEIVAGSASESIEKIVNNRLFGYVAAWGLSIVDEVLVSAIAKTGDIGVDSSDESVLNNPRALLGRSNLPLERLDTPNKCAMDESYQRGQVPIRAPKQNYYDNEGLHRAVKAATRSHGYPASVTSSRRTVKSKIRKKQDVVTLSHGETTDPRPGVPYSTEVPNKGRHHIASPRNLLAVHHPDSGDSAVGAGLQLNIDTTSIRQEKNEESTGSRRSPPPLSKSPSSTTSLRRRPQPPGPQSIRTHNFGEREEDVKVEYVVQKSPPRRISTSTTNALPYIDKIAPRPSLLFPAFSAFGAITENCSDDQARDGDPTDQHFHAMPLSPGVKVRTGEESNDGPELPLFASKMRRSTFVRMDTITLTQASDSVTPRAHASSPTVQDAVQKLGKGTFLTETEAWEFSPADRRPAESQVTQGRNHHHDSNIWIKADDVLSAELTSSSSCSCASSTSLTLFRKQNKVQRPCRSCSNESNRREAINFSNLVKQRAFHMKPPCLPTSSSSSKRAPGASPRRVTSAPASSPLARRNLLISKTTDQLLNEDLERATQIM
ncbi:Unconventional myosin-Va [Phytophthora citrophthora]|uniref:Unconventional myosin-Va n=1 Tax=Phytophthora citrophthora TaxID=4793 RepID=A0AAD9GG39_9STRA|nr:Unconventional myosin-Va [Phytophthora citrophthora]